MEALARLQPDARDVRLERLRSLEADAIAIDDTLDSYLVSGNQSRSKAHHEPRAALAAAVQKRIGDLLLAFLRVVRDTLGRDDVCLGGRLF